MWKHPIEQHIKLLEGEWGVKNGGWIKVLKPVEKELACGVGAMADLVYPHLPKNWLSSSQDITSAYHNNAFKSTARVHVRVRELTKGLRVIPSYKSIVRWSHSKD